MWFFDERRNPAQQRYRRSGMGILFSYFGLLFGSAGLVHHFRPQGWHLYLAAILPCIPIVMLVYVVGRYLREEKDEFQRDSFIRSLLWGIAAMLVVEVFSGFLRTFGWTGSLPPFAGVLVLFLSMLIAKLVYRFRNRVGSDE